MNQIVRLFTLIGILGISMSLWGQNMQLEVVDFALVENSLTAKNTPVYDNNQEKCALVIISGMEDEILRFNVGNSFSKVEEKSSNGKRNYLLWIPEGVVKVIISSDSKAFEPVEYFFNPRVKKAETYLMELELTNVSSSIGKQYLEFHLEPATAYLEVNGEPWIVNNGIAYRQVPKGKYSYSVRAKDFYTESGIYDFKDLSVKRTIDIKLKPNFGWLTINNIEKISDISVFIDEENYKYNNEKIKLSSGNHRIVVLREMYLPFDTTVIVHDEQETILSPNFKPNFSEVAITVQDDASIYIDGEYLGNGGWTGRLPKGSYKLELKKNNYKSKIETILVPKIGERYKFTYNSLVPIIGAVSVESTPPGATVKIDGENYGKTPLYISESLVGAHTIELYMDGYETINELFQVPENQQANLNYALCKIQTPIDKIKEYIDNKNKNCFVEEFLLKDNNLIIKNYELSKDVINMMRKVPSKELKANFIQSFSSDEEMVTLFNLIAMINYNVRIELYPKTGEDNKMEIFLTPSDLSQMKFKRTSVNHKYQVLHNICEVNNKKLPQDLANGSVLKVEYNDGGNLVYTVRYDNAAMFQAMKNSEKLLSGMNEIYTAPEMEPVIEACRNADANIEYRFYNSNYSEYFKLVFDVISKKARKI